MQPGEVIDGRFVLERFIARGGMGEVYRAHDRRAGAPVALKVMAHDDEVLAERFALEARALLELDHPAVVRYVAHGETATGVRYLAMEWLDGVTLSTWLRQHTLSIDQTLRLATRVAAGLGAAHARGMIHRDIKPGNIMMVERRVDWTKVLDFGLVRNPWQDLTATGAGMGTPDYMSPEQARGVRAVTPASDVFALGSVLYRCITGQKPFAADHAQEVLARIATCEQPPRVVELCADVPAAIDDLVATMMAADPAARPSDGAAAAALLEAARAGLSAADGQARPVDAASLTTRE
ncbi:MAG: serine/threonine protein kinase, partial [Myxococcales bacterium]|nr:serine/threonine protein kinase [Myxococcales bacterium]